MAANAPLVWFEIPVADMTRAKAFYEAVLEIELAVHDMNGFRMAWFPMQGIARGSAGCLMQGASYVPSHAGTLVYLHVDAIDACLARVASHGGRVLNPKMAIGDYGFVGHFEDCEGNRVALHADS